MDIKVGEKYKHFKGTVYRVIGIAKHSETLAEMVIYHKDGDDTDLWVRPIEMWHDIVSRDNYQGPRFTLLNT